MILRSATDLGLLIRRERRAQGLDQQTLAKRIGVSRQWVIEVEKGKDRAEVGLVLKALHAVGLRLHGQRADWVAPGTDGQALPSVDLSALVREGTGDPPDSRAGDEESRLDRRKRGDDA